MSDERPQLSFSPIDLGIVNTNIISEAEIDTFLGSDPDGVTNIEEAETKPAPKASTKPKKEEKPEETQEPSLAKQVLDADALGDEEDEEKSEDPKKKKPEEEAQEQTETEDNVFSSLTKELQDLGVFTVFEDEPEIKDGNQFKSRFDEETKYRTEILLDNFIGRFGEDFKKAFQAIYIDGNDPREYFQQSHKIADLEEFDLTVVDNQKQIIREYYKSLGWPADKISARIQKLEDIGGLEEDATGYHQVLLQNEKTQMEEVQARKAQEQFQKQQAEQHYQAAVTKILSEKVQKKDFDGIPIDEKLAQSTRDYLTTNKYRASNGDLLTDFDLEILNLKRPENYEQKAKIGLILQIMKTDPELKILSKKAISKEKDEVFSSLTRQKITKKKQGEEVYSSWGVTK